MAGELQVTYLRRITVQTPQARLTVSLQRCSRGIMLMAVRNLLLWPGMRRAGGGNACRRYDLLPAGVAGAALSPKVFLAEGLVWSFVSWRKTHQAVRIAVAFQTLSLWEIELVYVPLAR